MPLHVAPGGAAARMSRRSFLRTTALGAGGILAIGREGFAQPAQHSVWALLADTHVAADASLVKNGGNMSGRLGRVVRDILSRDSLPHHAVINGDCAFMTGESGDYEQLARQLAPLIEKDIPVTFAMGNHDSRDPFFDAFAKARPVAPPVDGKHITLIETPSVDWIVIDTLMEVNVTTGEVGERQRQWLAETLDRSPSRPAVILGHHNPTPGAKKADKAQGIADTDPLFEILQSRPRVKAYIYGHTHTWNVSRTDAGIHLVNLPPIGYVFDKNQPLGWVEARAGQDGLRLELRPLESETPEVKELAWR